MDGTMLILLAIIFCALLVFSMARRSTAGKVSGPDGKTDIKPKVSTATTQMVEDIRLTKTSRVVDEVSIVDELSQHTPGFRQYCELVGTSGSDAGLVAPYSKRRVAFYDIRCFRIERVNGQLTETLVAHERSFDPFYFTDSSTDEKVYIDLDTFGDDAILVNSTNHIEGPNSEFAKAVGASGSSYKTSGVTAFAASAIERASNVLSNVRDALTPAPQPALAFAGAAASYGGASGPASLDAEKGSNVVFASGKSGAPNQGRSPASRGGSRPPARPPHSPRPSSGVNVNVHIPGMGMGIPGMTPGLGSFIGGSDPRVSTPYSRRRTSNEELAGAMLGLGLSALLSSIEKNSAQRAAEKSNSFQGYRLIEDVVPLGGPIYCIGEIYRSGTQIHMGRSLADDYPTSFFACKPEAEVLSSLSAQ